MANVSPEITLNRSALRGNIAYAKQTFAPQCSLMVAVKSNAYGLGASLVIPEVIAAGADELAVLDIATGLVAKELAPTTPVLAWLLGAEDDYQSAVDVGVELGVSTLGQLDALGQISSTPAIVHLKVDTGLARNGATAEQWPALVDRAKELEEAGTIQVRAIWSHLADTSLEHSRQQLSTLHGAIDIARARGLNPAIAHIAASHAAVELPEARLDMVRLGILAYGVSPFDDHTVADLGFHPVVSVSAPVVSIDSDTVEIGIGFAHGLLQPSAEAWVSVNGSPAQVLTVGPQTSTVRVNSSSPSPAIGDQVRVIGNGVDAPSVEQWAHWCNTIGDEIIVRLHPDIPRRFV